MTRSTTPRFVIKAEDGRSQSFEFPIITLTGSRPLAFLCVEADDINAALRRALVWAENYSAKQQGPPVFPQVRYGIERDRRVVKRFSPGSYVWLENASHGSWAPVDTVSL